MSFIRKDIAAFVACILLIMLFLPGYRRVEGSVRIDMGIYRYVHCSTPAGRSPEMHSYAITQAGRRVPGFNYPDAGAYVAAMQESMEGWVATLRAKEWDPNALADMDAIGDNVHACIRYYSIYLDSAHGDLGELPGRDSLVPCEFLVKCLEGRPEIVMTVHAGPNGVTQLDRASAARWLDLNTSVLTEADVARWRAFESDIEVYGEEKKATIMYPNLRDFAPHILHLYSLCDGDDQVYLYLRCGDESELAFASHVYGGRVHLLN